MKALSLKLRLAAAVLALGASSSIVWAMSSYAYPDAPPLVWGQLAHGRACSS